MMARGKTSNNTLMINGAGAAIAVLSVAYMVRATFVTEQVAPCSTRFPGATEFSLKSKSGKLMSPEELEARAGSASFGMRENTSAVSTKGAPSPAAFKVRIAKDTGSFLQETYPHGGMSFRWNPSGLKGATSACLSYAVFLPADFDFGAAGALPGLIAGASFNPKAYETGVEGFVARTMWGRDGAGEVNIALAMPEEMTFTAVDQGKFHLERGRWVAVEQEVRLNTPGQHDGVLRLWLDGNLAVQRNDVPWRNNDAIRLEGVLSDVSYGGIQNTSVAPADTEINLTAPKVSWQ